MKTTLKLLIALIGLTSSTAFAAFEMQDTEISRTVVQISGVDRVIKSIKINETGVMTVAYHSGDSQKLKLSRTNSEMILNEARALAEAEVITENRSVVCKMMISPFSLQKLSIINLETNRLRLILTTQSCALSSVTYPTDRHALELAENLKTQLIALAQQLTDVQVNIIY